MSKWYEMISFDTLGEMAFGESFHSVKAENFADPTAFKPERWLDPNSTDVKEASQPFSMGPRGCLGQK
ncbi:hypothetical protein ACO1O0_002698 [Amphichorda felina]